MSSFVDSTGLLLHLRFSRWMHVPALGTWLLWAVLAWCVVGIGGAAPAAAQQKIGYVDTEYVLNNMPEYATIQQKLDKLEQKWRKEIEQGRQKVETLEQEFEARELLYTEEERKRRQQAIQQARTKVEQLRQQYFGPEGELYTRQKELMRPLQERILEATERVATADGYDYVVDQKGDALFLYARDEHDLSDRVLLELGINVDQQSGGRQ
ncbi:OmpH family outer membrane protein [Salinibacter sp. 10B]|uniref:OmpH family outer membrane protein n=1 Tax=Salinibacter sp. 10B TaxID=1923971 RepID=UPI002157B250|nr:OmpH family outer membrane protein [Salinibacter sp. 10B]